ncbi:DHHC-type zinc finger-containing protein [Encephalitozoon intestinalis ATCC 50506]|uniref:Palmitoyltransferase n=1 Tax=Encephalitozoon intestinalis (strain ATCC 50506) TaxID=876142 RepID=E0S6H6_ENCIT|nr:DHHC-type zinc finger-containing protein [Encephalitozoon intestinalis ATCC 50506]ADM11311.1 DHHC-type zinc finger-containing protein [Encephalitozoon intestinalis ATCC 50506]UTX44997.1 DHHC palmitoyltransferase [Encephalitozoon intestinalis]
MGWKEFRNEVLRVAAFTIYPTLELYVYFVFVGILCLEDTEFDSWMIFVLFVAYHVIVTYKAMFYMKLFINEGTSTLEIFPDIPQDGYDMKLKGMNKFVEEEMMKQTIAKIKLCSKCKTYKPPRSHHCGTCKRCYLKYDHHCALLNTCIGFHNYKFFYQFMILNLVSVIFFIVTIFIYMTLGIPKTKGHWVNYIVSMSLMGIEFVFNLSLLIFHTWLIGMNETTIEHYALNDYVTGDHSLSHIFQEGPMTTLTDSIDRRTLNPYNLGWKQNWKQVFGTDPLDWVTPSYSTVGNGISFPKNYDEYDII